MARQFRRTLRQINDTTLSDALEFPKGEIAQGLTAMMKTALIIFLTTIFMAGCVTVRLGSTNSGSHAEGVTYQAPRSPFQKDDRDDVDAAWKNPKTGNVISYLSDCGDPNDPPLDHIVQGVLSALTDLKYDSNESQMFQDRAAKHVVAEGTVDGVPSKTELLVFKRNQCMYILSYVGVKKAFDADRDAFNGFLQGFRAP